VARVFTAELSTKRVRDWYTATFLRVATIVSRTEPQTGDLVSIGDGWFYFHRDQFASYLVHGYVARDPNGQVVAGIRAPGKFREFAKRHRRRGIEPERIEFVARFQRPRGRIPRASVAADQRITVRVTRLERRRWEIAAAGRTLGDWIRDACNSAARRRNGLPESR
jgi:hypothetical protein